MFHYFRSLRRFGQTSEKVNRGLILAPLIGIILNLLDASNKADCQESNDLVDVFASMDCPDTVHYGFQYLLDYNWVRYCLPFSILNLNHSILVFSSLCLYLIAFRLKTVDNDYTAFTIVMLKDMAVTQNKCCVSGSESGSGSGSFVVVDLLICL